MWVLFVKIKHIANSNIANLCIWVDFLLTLCILALIYMHMYMRPCVHMYICNMHTSKNAYCSIQLSVTVTKSWHKSTHKPERFISVHSFRWQSLVLEPEEGGTRYIEGCGGPGISVGDVCEAKSRRKKELDDQHPPKWLPHTGIKPTICLRCCSTTSWSTFLMTQAFGLHMGL